MNELIELTKDWFLRVGLTGPNGKGTLSKQAKKNLEEAGEIVEEAAIYIFGDRSPILLQQEIGDNLVTLIGLCEMLGTTPQECLQLAYGKISMRKGSIIDSQFVKES